MYKQEYQDGSAFFKIPCDCGANDCTSDLFIDRDEFGYWELRISIEDLKFRVYRKYYEWLAVELVIMFWRRLVAAAKILYNGHIEYSASTILSNSNIDDLYKVITEARKKIKSNATLA